MQWAVLIDRDPPDPDLYGVGIPFLGTWAVGHSYEHALEMAREEIARMLNEIVAGWKQHELRTYQPELMIIEVDLPTPEEAVRQMQAEALTTGAALPLTLRETADRYGTTVFALRRAIWASKIPYRRIGPLYVVYLAEVERWQVGRLRPATEGDRH